ncbi:uridine diphosphate-N-acetylglucosamine-binding protein YvcK [Actinobacteria bacterium IMCC25003]|nr:uridine diphosphate-N-acetylglucosamine-binding protein YvcK [Actinobacteria bacterium IMCC25003]
MSSGRKVVALGGGHGLAATLTALRSFTSHITAVVTVADNGGSSGRLREEFPILPPGDLRMALAALCSDDEWGRSWADIMQYRFTSEGELNGHAVGNLLLAALWDRDEDTVAGLDRVGALLKVIGRVLPMACEPLDIEATFENSIGTKIVRGQAEVATTKGRLKSLRIIPENPTAYAEALTAIADAEWITMGPGSWFSSVIPHLLVPAQRDAIISSEAKKILLLNLDIADKSAGEYAGYSPLEHLHILSTYAPALHFDCVVIDSSAEGQNELRDHLSTIGSELVVADLRSAGAPLHHDVKKLGQLFSHIDSQILVG